MDRRIETRVVDTGGGAKTTLVQKDACEVWWITVSPETVDTAGVVKIYDGFDAEGKLEWQLETGRAGTHNFVPPIPCDQGIFVSSDANIASFAIAFRPKKWSKE